jgi:peptidoglycan/xylan/chitin deacetylase (PgdA/CDA1 family)
MTDNKGVFTLSLDTEFAWGTFDKGHIDQFADAYQRTPEVIDRLCELFDEYEIPATWAIVSHLLEDCDDRRAHAGRTSPDFDWFGELPCTSGVDKDLWYAPWLVDRIQSCETDQEIGLHGATHMQFGADGCSQRIAEEELEAAVETLGRYGVEPKSFVFPRNDVGHVDMLAEYGIEAYRGVDARWYERSNKVERIRGPLRFADEAVRWTPPVSKPVERDGVLEIPGSQVFRPSHGGWQFTPGDSSVARAKKGLQRAARTDGLFHLWFHPFNLGHEPGRDLERLEQVLTAVRELVEQDEIECQRMQEVRKSES